MLPLWATSPLNAPENTTVAPAVASQTGFNQSGLIKSAASKAVLIKASAAVCATEAAIEVEKLKNSVLGPESFTNLSTTDPAAAEVPAIVSVTVHAAGAA